MFSVRADIRLELPVFILDIDRPVNFISPMEQARDTRQRLLDCALQLFYSRSYADVGVQEICQTAGVKKGSFYHFFPSKRDLALAALDSSWDDFRGSLLAAAFHPDIPPLQRITRLLERVYQHHKAMKEQCGRVLGCPYGNLAGEMSTQDEALRAQLNRIFRELEAPLAAALDEAVTAGDLQPLDTVATAAAMVAYLEGLTLMAKTRNDPEIIPKLGPAILGLAVR